MHVFSLTNVDNIFILDEGTKNFKKRSKIEQLWWDIQITVLNSGHLIAIQILLEPFFPPLRNSSGETSCHFFFFSQVYNLIITGHLILRNDFHDHVLIDIVPFVIKNDRNPEEVKEL